MPFVTSFIGLINLSLLIIANIMLGICIWQFQRIYPLLRAWRGAQQDQQKESADG